MGRGPLLKVTTRLTRFWQSLGVILIGRKTSAASCDALLKCKVHERNIAFSKLTILAGMRNLADVVEQEAKQMPIHYDIRDHQTIGPVIRREHALGVAEGLPEGKKAGEATGRREEAISLLQRQIATRFGSISTTTKRRLGKLTLTELEELAIRVLTAKGVNDLFGR